jgi:hypothetical protein
MTSLAGVWDVTMKTPIGTLTAVYTFGGDPISGTARSGAETVPLVDLVADAATGRVTWRQSVTKPIRLNLTFDVTVTGTALSGHSRAGLLPRTVVSGVRRAPSPTT